MAGIQTGQATSTYNTNGNDTRGVVFDSLSQSRHSRLIEVPVGFMVVITAFDTGGQDIPCYKMSIASGSIPKGSACDICLDGTGQSTAQASVAMMTPVPWVINSDNLNMHILTVPGTYRFVVAEDSPVAFEDMYVEFERYPHTQQPCDVLFGCATGGV